MQQRIAQFLQAENISPAQFADRIGVQRSGVSHILSGRNKPGFDFIEKTLHYFPALNAEWLITGRGRMYKELTQASLFPGMPTAEPAAEATAAGSASVAAAGTASVAAAAGTGTGTAAVTAGTSADFPAAAYPSATPSAATSPTIASPITNPAATYPAATPSAATSPITNPAAAYPSATPSAAASDTAEPTATNGVPFLGQIPRQASKQVGQSPNQTGQATTPPTAEIHTPQVTARIPFPVPAYNPSVTPGILSETLIPQAVGTATPTTPIAPAVPTAPIAPAAPTAPITPATPTTPTAPAAPIAPAVPTTPIAPAAPTAATAIPYIPSPSSTASCPTHETSPAPTKDTNLVPDKDTERTLTKIILIYSDKSFESFSV